MDKRVKLINKRSDYLLVPIVALWMCSPFILSLAGKPLGALVYFFGQAVIFYFLEKFGNLKDKTELEEKKIAFSDAIIDAFFENEMGGLDHEQIATAATETGVLVEVQYDPKEHMSTVINEEIYTAGDPVLFRSV